MVNMKIPTLIIGIVVAIIVVASVLVPAINDASWKETTAQNDTGYFRMEWSKDFDLTTGYINETALTDIEGTDDTMAIVLTDKFIAIAYASGGTFQAWSVMTPTVSGGQTTVSTVTSVEVDGGAYTITANDEALETGTITWGLIMDDEGSMIRVGSVSDSAKVNTSSIIVSYATTSSDYGVSYGTLNSNVQCFKCISRAVDTTFTPVIVSSAITDTTAYSITNKTSGANPQYTIAPYECVYSEKRTDGYIPILAAIPLMVIAAILLAAVSLIRKP